MSHKNQEEDWAEGEWEDEDWDLDPEQWEEIKRRMAEHDKNPDSVVPWEELRARLYRRFSA